ncbi:uncharacterized protein [Asterias amurensis]|uniref:uncharacterized protein n=1 Tax=Asterias amurensis TaxID=7602 RepID=UPI003AB8F308
MAARIRLKLNFDGSVCPQITPRKCWFLVNKDDCNVVADLEYLIRERFELDRGQILSLTLDSFLLPSMEKIHVVRDNDTIWVHAEQIDNIVDDLQVSKSPTPLSESVTDTEVSVESNQHSSKQQRRKRKCSEVTEETSPRKFVHKETVNSEEQDNDRTSNESTEVSVQMSEESQPKKNFTKKKKKKNKKKNSREPDEGPKTPPKSRGTSKKDNSKQKGKNTSHHDISPRTSSNSEKGKSRKKREDKTTSSDCASKIYQKRSKTKISEDSTDDLHKRLASSPVSSTKSSRTLSTITPVTRPEHVENETSKLTAGLLLNVEKNQVREKKRSVAPTVLTTGHIRFDSSESEVSSEDDSDADNGKQTSKQSETSQQSETSKQPDKEQTDKVQPGTEETFERRDQPGAQNCSAIQSPAVTPSGERKPGFLSLNNMKFKRQNSLVPHQVGTNSRGKGSETDSWPWDRGNWDKNSQLNTTQSNKSVIIENPPQESEPVLKDFTSFPPLVGPPRQGDVIAYKILELSESYCPELSNYKEGKVLSVDSATGQLEIELSHVTMVTRASKPGKFDLQWDAEEGGEEGEMNVTNNNSVDLNVSVQLGDLVDPRLVPPMSV